MKTAPLEAPRVAVIGLGNVLLGDDGFGPTVVELLGSGWHVPANVELIDAGTPGLDLAGYMHGYDEIILVDAVAASTAPGEIRLYSGDELKKLPMKPRVSPHDPALQEALWIAEVSGDGPRAVVLVGAVPSNSEPGVGLSPAMFAAAEEAAANGNRSPRSTWVSPRTRIRRKSTAWWLQRTAPLEPSPPVEYH